MGRWLALGCAVLIAASAHAATYFASPTGTGRACLADKPCSLSACLGRVGPGDTCEALAGTYEDPPPLRAMNSCKATARCTFKSSKPLGAKLVINKEGPASLTISGNHWVVDGFHVLMNAQRQFTVANADTGFTWSNNRVEVRPGVGGEVLWTNGTDDVTVIGNWVHHVPGCQNGGGEYGGCGRHSRCDFDTNNGDAFLFLGDGLNKPTTGLVFSRNDYGHWQNPMRVRNFTDVTYTRNRCTNATNHGCIEADDVRGLLIENNIADIDTGAGCQDEILQSALFDTYCFADVIIRNNTSVGHGIGWEQQLNCLAPNAGADKACSDGTLPEVGRDGTWYDHLRIYNNIVYDGKPSSGAAGITLNTGQSVPTPEPCCFSDYNLIFQPSGGKIGIDGGKMFKTFAEWQARGNDKHGKSVAPQFVDYCNTFGTTGCRDYRPASAKAPQVDAGLGTAAFPCPPIDFDGNPRSDGRCDIGAHEFQAPKAPVR